MGRGRSLKVKLEGDHDLVERFLDHIEEHFNAITSRIMNSDRGGYYAFATILEGRE